LHLLYLIPINHIHIALALAPSHHAPADLFGIFSKVEINNTMEEILVNPGETSRLTSGLDDEDEGPSIISQTNSHSGRDGVASRQSSRYRGTLAQAVAAAIKSDENRRNSRDFHRGHSRSPSLAPRLDRQTSLPPLDASNWI
jgi:hypothetical protein